MNIEQRHYTGRMLVDLCACRQLISLFFQWKWKSSLPLRMIIVSNRRFYDFSMVFDLHELRH